MGHGRPARAVAEAVNIDVPVQDWGVEEGADDDVIRERLEKAADEAIAQKVAAFGPDNMRQIEKQMLLQTLMANGASIL